MEISEYIFEYIRPISTKVPMQGCIRVFFQPTTRLFSLLGQGRHGASQDTRSWIGAMKFHTLPDRGKSFIKTPTLE